MPAIDIAVLPVFRQQRRLQHGVVANEAIGIEERLAQPIGFCGGGLRRTLCRAGLRPRLLRPDGYGYTDERSQRDQDSEERGVPHVTQHRDRLSGGIIALEITEETDPPLPRRSPPRSTHQRRRQHPRRWPRAATSPGPRATSDRSSPPFSKRRR